MKLTVDGLELALSTLQIERVDEPGFMGLRVVPLSARYGDGSVAVTIMITLAEARELRAQTNKFGRG